ncbi:MAG: hypothetical protein J3Q66DRAFT_368063 [Benniella sp.]|nr:MAG: hypothetical protein J3Q66DRAFT_368063 [Benniella sp.]
MLDVGVSVKCCAFFPLCILLLTWTAVMYLRYGAYRRCVSVVVSVVSRTRRYTSVDCAITVVWLLPASCLPAHDPFALATNHKTAQHHALPKTKDTIEQTGCCVLCITLGKDWLIGRKKGPRALIEGAEEKVKELTSRSTAL